MARLELDGVVKDYPGGVRALDGVTLHVADGELVTIVGPSGCGKSTLLRIAAGLEKPTAGTVHIGGEDVTALAPQRRDLAMVFQDNVLYPRRTVESNLEFPLAVRRIPREERRHRVAAEAEAFHLTEFLGYFPGQLSAGHQQAAQTAKSLVRAPRLFLMDEPLARIDAARRTDLRHQIALVQRGYGVTMLYVSNDRDEAMALGDRVAVMRAGRILQIAPPREIHDRPVDRFVAGFVADHSFLTATVRPEAGGFRITLGDAGFQAWSPSLSGRSSVVLGVAPGHLRAGKPLPGGVVVPGRVTTVERLGSRTIVRGKAASGPVQAATDDFSGDVGDEVGFAFDPADVHAFDPATGAALYHPSGPAVSGDAAGTMAR